MVGMYINIQLISSHFFGSTPGPWGMSTNFLKITTLLIDTCLLNYCCGSLYLVVNKLLKITTLLIDTCLINYCCCLTVCTLPSGKQTF